MLQVLTAIGNFCIVSIAIGIIIEIIVMYPIQGRGYRAGIDNLLVLLIGGIPIAMPTVLSVTMAIGAHRLAKQGAIVKRMTAIEEMAGMDILCSDKTGTLTLNKLTVDKAIIEIFTKGVTQDDVVMAAARASRVENQDAIDAAITQMLPDIKDARAGIQELHFLPFNPVDKRTAITYIDQADGKMKRQSKGAPEQILALAHDKDEIKVKVHDVIDKFAERGLRALGVARQEVPDNNKDGPGGPWEMMGLLPLYDPPRHDTAETIKRALNLGVNVKMVTGNILSCAWSVCFPGDLLFLHSTQHCCLLQWCPQVTSTSNIRSFKQILPMVRFPIGWSGVLSRGHQEHCLCSQTVAFLHSFLQRFHSATCIVVSCTYSPSACSQLLLWDAEYWILEVFSNSKSLP